MAKDSVLEARFNMHEKQCVTDKQEFREQFKSIHNKLWALIIGLLINLGAVVGYLVTQGTPWEQAKTIIADRGERK